MLRVVLDTNVVAAASRSKIGAGAAIVRLVLMRRVRMLATPPLFLEYEDVLKRPDQRIASGLTIAEVDQVLGALAECLEAVEVYFRWRPQLTDSDDELVLEAAVNGRADALVTYNIRDFVVATQRFGVALMTPSELVNRLIAR